MGGNKVSKTTSVGQSGQEGGGVLWGVYSTRWWLFTFSDRAVDAVLEQCLEKTLGSRGSVTAEVAQTLPWLTSTICVEGCGSCRRCNSDIYITARVCIPSPIG